MNRLGKGLGRASCPSFHPRILIQKEVRRRQIAIFLHPNALLSDYHGVFYSRYLTDLTQCPISCHLYKRVLILSVNTLGKFSTRASIIGQMSMRNRYGYQKMAF